MKQSNQPVPVAWLFLLEYRIMQSHDSYKPKTNFTYGIISCPATHLNNNNRKKKIVAPETNHTLLAFISSTNSPKAGKVDKSK